MGYRIWDWGIRNSESERRKKISAISAPLRFKEGLPLRRRACFAKAMQAGDAEGFLVESRQEKKPSANSAPLRFKQPLIWGLGPT